MQGQSQSGAFVSRSPHGNRGKSFTLKFPRSLRLTRAISPLQSSTFSRVWPMVAAKYANGESVEARPKKRMATRTLSVPFQQCHNKVDRNSEFPLATTPSTHGRCMQASLGRSRKKRCSSRGL